MTVPSTRAYAGCPLIEIEIRNLFDTVFGRLDVDTQGDNRDPDSQGNNRTLFPAPEIDPVLPDGILLFDAKSWAFTDEAKIPAASWAEKVLKGTRSEEEKRKAVAAEGPKILATINAVSAGEFQSLPGTLGGVDLNYISNLVTIAGAEGVDPDAIACRDRI